MPVTNYHTLNGRIRGETTNGVRTNYLSDALGSLTGTTNPTAQLLNSYRHKPYGARLSKSGTAADPRSNWVGQRGYRNTDRSFSGQFVRARHYDNLTGRWTTKDPVWPQEPQYEYASSRPTLIIDPSGLQSQGDVFYQTVQSQGKCCEYITQYLYNSLYDSGIDQFPRCFTRVNKNCAKLWSVLEKCQQSFGINALCSTFGSEGYSCCEAAKSMGVDSTCLCAVLLAERNFFNRWKFVSAVTDRLSLGSTFGCAQLSIGTTKQVLEKLKKCLPGLQQSAFPGYPYSESQIRNLLTNNCAWSMKVAAAHLKVNTDPRCTKSGLRGTCENFAFNIWNKSDTTGKLKVMMRCTVEALRAQNPCLP